MMLRQAANQPVISRSMFAGSLFLQRWAARSCPLAGDSGGRRLHDGVLAILDCAQAAAGALGELRDRCFSQRIRLEKATSNLGCTMIAPAAVSGRPFQCLMIACYSASRMS